MNPTSLIPDQALGEYSNSREDELGFSVYADVLASTAIGTQGPFTIGVFGEWGTGKTSLLKLIEKRLTGKEMVIPVWFNAWRYERENDPLIPLLSTIILILKKQKTTNQKIKDEINKVSKALQSIVYGLTFKAEVQIPAIVKLGLDWDGEKTITKDRENKIDKIIDNSLDYQLFNRFDELKNVDIKIVVIIDDLDRCLPDSAIKLLESIKLILNQAGYIFILGVSKSIIEGYLDHRYEVDFGIKDFDSKSYLDKLIQLPFYIPSHEKRLEAFFSELVKKNHNLSLQEKDDFYKLSPFIGLLSDNKPRNLIRFLNNLLIDKAINEELSRNHEMEKIPILYFAVTRFLQQKWYKVYLSIYNNQRLCERLISWENEEIEPNGDLEVKITGQIKANPTLEGLLFSEIGKQWMENFTTRVEAENFLSLIRNENKIQEIYQADVQIITPSYSNELFNIVLESIETIIINQPNIVFYEEIIRNNYVGDIYNIDNSPIEDKIQKHDNYILVIDKIRNDNLTKFGYDDLVSRTQGNLIIVCTDASVLSWDSNPYQKIYFVNDTSYLRMHKEEKGGLAQYLRTNLHKSLKIEAKF